MKGSKSDQTMKELKKVEHAEVEKWPCTFLMNVYSKISLKYPKNIFDITILILLYYP